MSDEIIVVTDGDTSKELDLFVGFYPNSEVLLFSYSK